MKIEFELNGTNICIEAPGDRRAVDLLREDLGFTGTKEGCGTGECGACTILVDGRSRLSCLMLAAQLAGRKVVTIEGLAQDNALHPVQASFAANGAVQCGFCTPGMVLTAVDLLNRNHNPGREEVAAAISGNLCRCTGYKKIVEAIAGAGQAPRMELRQDEGYGRLPVRQEREEKGTRPVFSPQSLEELWRLYSLSPGARLFAGGTDLLVHLRSGKVDPAAALISLARIQELQGVAEQADGVRIGACVTHETLLEHPVIRRHFPVLTRALQTLGSPHIRHMGTIGGNIITASPAGDTLPPLYVLGAQVELQSSQGKRVLPVESFIRGPGRTALAADEILAAVFIPIPLSMPLQYFEKVGLRGAMACAVASMAAAFGLSQSGRIENIRLAWGSVGPTIVRLPEVEAALVGRFFQQQTLASVVPMVRQHLAPISDVRATADYRRLVAGNLLLRLPAIFPGPSMADSEGPLMENAR